jgi:hypothetical protein
LQSLKDESAIRKLSARELKVLLDDNFVDYKGCVEKEELVQRVLMIWKSKNLQQNGQLKLSAVLAIDHSLYYIFNNRKPHIIYHIYYFYSYLTSKTTLNCAL